MVDVKVRPTSACWNRRTARGNEKTGYDFRWPVSGFSSHHCTCDISCKHPRGAFDDDHKVCVGLGLGVGLDSRG